MNKSGRTIMIVLFFAILFILGILFRSFIQANFVTPLAIVFWVFWRLLESVDQIYYWSALIFLALIYVFSRLIREPAGIEKVQQPASNATLENISYWRSSILYTNDEIEKANYLKHNLGMMLAGLYVSKQPGAANFEVYEALKLHQIPLPEHIYTFLFPAEPGKSRRSFKQVLEVIRRTPEKWISRWTRRDIAEYYQSIEEVIAFMESLMEIKYEDGHFETHNH